MGGAVVSWTRSLLEAAAPGGRKAALQLREPAGLRPGSAGLRGPSASRALGLSLGEMLDSHGQGEAWRGSAVLCETLAPAGWLPFPSDLPGSADQQAGCSRRSPRVLETHGTGVPPTRRGSGAQRRREAQRRRVRRAGMDRPAVHPSGPSLFPDSVAEAS